MDDRFLRYLKEDGQLWGIEGMNDPINDPINQPQVQSDPINQLNTTKSNPVLDPQKSLRAAFMAANDQTQPPEPMNVQAEIQNSEPTNEKDLIIDIFKKIGWDKYIKEESIIGGQNANEQNS